MNKNIFSHIGLFQAIQIPFILATVALLAIITNASNEKQLRLIKTPKLGYLIVAFSCNLIYVALSIAWQINYEKPPVLFHFTTFSDIITSFFLYIAFLDYYLKKIKATTINKSISITILLAITLLIIVDNIYLQTGNFKYNVSIYIYDFFSYTFTAFFLLGVTKSENSQAEKYHANYLISGGFFAWAILHPFAYLAKWSPEAINFAAFCVSTLAKVSILYGFFAFFIQASKNAIIKLTDEQRKITENLEILQSLFGDIAEKKKITELEDLALKHLIYSKIFNFDYACIVKSDALTSTIFTTEQSRNNSQSSKYFHDAMKPIYTHCIKNNVKLNIQKNGKNKTTSNGEVHEMILSQCINLIENQNEYATHYLVPLSIAPNLDEKHNNNDSDQLRESTFNYLQTKSTSSQKVIGIIHIAIKEESNQATTDLQEEVTLIDLYARNFSLLYNRLIEGNLIENVTQLILSADRVSGDEEFVFIKAILENFCDLFSADSGFINIPTCGNEELQHISMFNKSHQHSTKNNNRVSTNLENSTNNQDKSIVENSQLELSISHQNITIGSLHFLSSRESFFNKDRLDLIKNSISEIGQIYIEKKFHRAIGDIISAEALATDSEGSMESIAKTICSYFKSDNIAIWIIENPHSKSASLAFIKTKLTEIDDLDTLPLDKMQYEGQFSNSVSVYSGLNEIDELYKSVCKKNGYNSLIVVRLEIDNQLYGQINIFFRKYTLKLFLEDEHFLRMASDKLALSIAVSRIVKGFLQISESLIKKSEHDVLKEITNMALTTLHSEPVLLFLIEDQVPTYDDIITSGDIKRMDKILEGNRRNFINIILDSNNDHFFSDRTDLPKEYDPDNNFWEREGIMSMAAIILKQNSENIGIMFFNYRQRRSFPYFVKQLIKTFAYFATTAIANARNVKTIVRQREELAKRAEKIEFDHAEVLDKMEKMLPVANAKSLADIVRAVNHDIRNHLDKINLNLISIESNHSSVIRSRSDLNGLLSNIKMIKGDIINSTSLIQLFEPNSFKISIENIFLIAQEVGKLFQTELAKKENSISVQIVSKSDSMPDMRCVKAEISMIIYNLITNARNAIFEKRKREDKQTTEWNGEINVSLNYEGQDRNYIIVVEDNGIGIDNSVISKIYEPGFTTRKGKGLGIGLFFVSETIKTSYSGLINCVSYVGKGTKFELKLKQHIK